MVTESIVNKIIKGVIKSPYMPLGTDEFPAENCIYVDLRITGTGVTKREINGMVVDIDRPFQDFASPVFLEACCGIPVTITHPVTDVNGDTFKNYTIGIILKAYVKGNEIWGIARIYDPIFFEAVRLGIKSTSPSIRSEDVLLPNGTYREEYLSINHLAIVPAGHWDAVSVIPAIRMDEKKNKGDIMEEVLEEKATEKKDEDIVKRVSDLEKTVADLIKAEKREDHPELKGDNKKKDEKEEDMEEKDLEKKDASCGIKKDESVDKRKLIDEVAGIMKNAGATDEQIRTAIGKMEELGYNKSSTKGKDDSKKDETVEKEKEVEKDDLSKKVDAMEKAMSEFKKVDSKHDAFLDIADENKKEECYELLFNLSLVKQDELKIPRKSEGSAAEYMMKAILANKQYVNDKYQTLIKELSPSKMDSSYFGIVNDIFSDMVQNIKLDTSKTLQEKRARYVQVAPNLVEMHGIFHS